MTNEQEIIQATCEATLDSIDLAMQDVNRILYLTWKNKRMQKVVQEFYDLKDQIEELRMQLEAMTTLHQESKQ